MRVLFVACVVLFRSVSAGKLRSRQLPWNSVEVPLRRTDEGWYVAELTLAGTSRRLVVDTGSPWLWSFAADGSQSAPEDAPHFDVHYCSARLEGVVLQETLGFSAETSPPSTGNCSVGRATAGDDFWLRQKTIDGVAGLSCGTADTGSAAAGNGLEVTGSCMARASGSSSFSIEVGESDGKLTLGPAPTRLLDGLVPMPSSMMCGNWRAPLQAWIGQGSAAKPVGRNVEAILDTGAFGINGPLSDVMSLAASLGADTEIRADGGVSFFAECKRNLPAATFVLGRPGSQVSVVLEGKDLMRGNETGKTCNLLLVGTEAKQWTLGLPFFRKIRGAVFDPIARGVSIAP